MEFLTFPRKDNPKLFIHIHGDLDSHMKRFEFAKDINSLFGSYLLPQTIIYESGAIRQTHFTKIKISAKALAELVPVHFSIKSLIEKYGKNITYKKEDKKNYIIQIRQEVLQSRHDFFTKTRWTALPIKIFLNSFAPKALGNYGIPFLFLTLFGYRTPNRLTTFKVSTWIKYGKLNTRRGVKHLCRRFNLRMRYLRKIGLVSTFDPMTPAAVHADKALKVRLNPNNCI